MSFFKELYSNDASFCKINSITSFPNIDTVIVESLLLRMEDDEIHSALFSKQGTKALGLDGILITFLPELVQTVKSSLCNFFD